MDLLNQYKEVWKHQNIDKQWDEHTFSGMMHKSSTSIVKWIFYVSLIEFGVVLLLNILIKTDWDAYKELGLYSFMKTVNIIGYIILFVFIFIFYKNYTTIKTTGTTKSLMQSILKTRKTVKYYIILNLVAVAVVLLYSFYVILQSPDYETLIEKAGYTTIWLIVASAILFVLGIIFLFYMLIYGFLIKKLQDNYRELTADVEGE